MNAMIATITYCIVGCNTGSPEHDSLKVLECDTETGAAKIVQSVNGCEGTTYFQLSRDGKALYSAIGEKRDEKTHGTLVKFDVDGHSIGKMTRLAELPCETPCHISLTPDEDVVSFAAYLSGTYGTCATHGRDACPQASVGASETRPYQSAVLPDDAIGPRADRQKKAYAHQTFYVPDADLMGVCDLGCDRINFYEYKKAGGLEKPVLTIKADPGDGPRHALFSPDGRFMYVLNELSSTVVGYEWSAGPSAGAGMPGVRRIGKWSMLPAGCCLGQADTKGAAIKTTADGKILMASNRGHDSIAFYEVGPEGALSLRNVAKLSGRFTRDFELMPGERFMVVGHKMSNEIQVYRFDRESCTISPAGDPIPCWRPLCFKFM